MRIVLCATHPWNTNGYSLVMSHLAAGLCEMEGVEKVHYFGFQNVTGDQSRNKRQLPDKVEVYDALANENPRKQGFGEDLIRDFVAERDPDVVVISNDSIVVELITAKLAEVPGRRFKTVVYQDMVYEHMKRRFVDQLNERADRVLAFTPYWKQHLQEQGVRVPVDVLRHAFDPESKYPVDPVLARRYFGISGGDFVVLNLNRNQPRKRWDLCLKAFAELLSRNRGAAIKLLVGTAPVGCWDLLAIYERELGKRGISMDEGRRHLVLVDAPQKLSDADVNILMNCADIGLSASDGEGFGLCNFEHAGIGRPQVVSNVGGHKDFFSPERAYLCEPAMAYYVDRTRDGVCGEAQLVDYRDLADGMEHYYKNPSVREAHGAAAREHILANYRWAEQARALHRSLLAALAPAPEAVGVPDEIDFIPAVRTPDAPIQTPTQTPDAQTVKPAQTPDARTPDAETKLPDAETKLPDAETKLPDVETKLPDVETKLPDVQTPETQTQDAQTQTPDAETNKLPDAQTPETQTQDAQTRTQDAQTQTPDAQTHERARELDAGPDAEVEAIRGQLASLAVAVERLAAARAG